MNKFEEVYKQIISEGNKPFKGMSVAVPERYLVNLPQVKQCILAQHFFDRFYQRLPITTGRQILYRNIQLFLEKIFNDKGCLSVIDFNEDENDPLTFYCSTIDQFNGQKGTHLCVIIKINSKTVNTKKEYYVQMTTMFIDDDKEYDNLVKNGYLSTKHPDQVPITIIGQSFEQVFK